MQDCLNLAGQRSVETQLFKVWVQANPPAAECTIDPELLPVQFKKIVIDVSPDKKAALEYWKSTGEPPAGFEIRKGEHLRIK